MSALTEAQEDVLVAVAELAARHLPPTPDDVGRRSQPPLTADDVRDNAAQLHSLGLLDLHDDGAGTAFFTLTHDGLEHVGAIATRSG